MGESFSVTHRHETGVRDVAPERMAAIVALAWRPAWSMRRRVGCLAPIITAVAAWLRRAPTAAGRDRPT